MTYPMLDADRIGRAGRRVAGGPDKLLLRLLRRFQVVDIIDGTQHFRLWDRANVKTPPRITQEELQERMPSVRRVH